MKCKNISCNNEVKDRSNKGKRRLYCSYECCYGAYNDKLKERRRLKNDAKIKSRQI